LDLLSTNKVEKLPIVDKNNKLVGLITVKDLVKTEQFPNSSKDASGRLLVAAGIGTGEEFYERAGLLVDAGVDVLIAYTALVHKNREMLMIYTVKNDFDSQIDVVGCNLAPRSAAKAMTEADVDVNKLGIGPDSICTTRVVAYVGALKFAAIM